MSRILRTFLQTLDFTPVTLKGLPFTKFSAKKYSAFKNVLLDKRLESAPLTVRCFSSANTFGPYELGNNKTDDDQIKSHNEDRLASRSQNLESQLMKEKDFENLLPSQQQKRYNDLLLNKIYECHTAYEVFEIYKRHKDVMNVQHHLAVVRQLNDLVAKGYEDGIKIREKDDFRDLCHQIHACSRRLELEELVSVLKYFIRLEIDPESKLIQTILQMLRHYVNDLNLKQMVFLEFLLKKMPPTTLSDALLTALPILIDNGLKEQEMKDLTLLELSKILGLCVRGTGRQTGMVLQEIYERGSINTAFPAVNIIWTLAKMHMTPGRRFLVSKEDVLTREILMKECLETVAKNLTSLTSQQIETTLTKLSEAYENRDHCCYNESFLHAVSTHAICECLSFEKIAHIIRKFLKMNYHAEDLVHHMIKMVLDCPQAVLEARIGVLPLLTSIAACEHHPSNTNDALDILLNHRSVGLDKEDYFKRPLLWIALYLLTVGHYNHKVLELLTDPDTLSIYMSRYSKESASQKRLLEVDQALCDLYPSSARVPEIFLENGRRLVRDQPSSRSNLKFILHQILNEPDYLISGLVTNNDIFVDHLLVLDDEGHLVKLKPTKSSLESNISIDSLEIPENYSRIAILDIGSSHSYKPGDHLNGHTRLKQKLLKARGFTVIVILQSAVFRHPQEEKVLYVKRELINGGVVFR
ncbi:uncharacterized protein [Panulirus ornatus]|uniref:uncharacterized protein n=1 Tax=Panulirus ornatus TaxID=150431 RepID=UPI003A836F2F